MEVVRKKAQELAEAIVNSPEYKRFMAAKGQVEAHQAALIMLRDFQKRQLELHKQQMEGTVLQRISGRPAQALRDHLRQPLRSGTV